MTTCPISYRTRKPCYRKETARWRRSVGLGGRVCAMRWYEKIGRFYFSFYCTTAFLDLHELTGDINMATPSVRLVVRLTLVLWQNG